MSASSRWRGTCSFRGVRFLLACLSLALSACSAAPPPLPVVAFEPPRPRAVLEVRGEIGGMNEEAVEKAFGRLEPEVARCVRSGADAVTAIGGHFEISLRIDPEGRARWAGVQGSTLGHRPTERCIAQAAREHAWPKPVGGDGLAKRAFDIEAGEPAIAWKEARVRGTVQSARASFGRCRRGQKGTFLVTAYVGPGGRVLATGVAPPDETAEDAADCVAEAVQGLRFASPGRRVAKVTFSLP